MSLTPVREALNSLAGGGLVVRNGRQGTHVRALGVQDIRNLFALRESLERLAVKQAAAHLTEHDHAKLATILERQAEANELLKTSKVRATKRLAQLNEDFHGLILERANNEWVETMLGSIGDLLVFARVQLRETAPWERRVQSLDEHSRIAAALRSKNAELAERIMAEHLRHLEEHVIARMLNTDQPIRAASETDA